jgi:hypothetical protein
MEKEDFTQRREERKEDQRKETQRWRFPDGVSSALFAPLRESLFSLDLRS